MIPKSNGKIEIGNSTNCLVFILGIAILLITCANIGIEQSDQAAIDSLREGGSDFSKAHPFDFYLYHTNKAGAQRLFGDLADQGFTTSVQEGALDGEFLCLAWLIFVPSAEMLVQVSELFEEIIAIYGGEYDGWDTVVISE